MMTSSRSPGKLLLNLAPTGMVPTRQMSPWVPISPEEIIADAVAAAAMGVNIVHIHARDDAGVPTYRKDVYARIIGGIREKCPDLIICVSLSGRTFGSFEERSDPLRLTGDVAPDMASLTLSSMNFAKVESVNSPDMIRRTPCILSAWAGSPLIISRLLSSRRHAGGPMAPPRRGQ